MNTMREMTARAYEALMLDLPLSPAARVDFGVESDAHYVALQRGVRSGRITLEALDSALGDGKALTALCANADEVAPTVVFETPYDSM